MTSQTSQSSSDFLVPALNNPNFRCKFDYVRFETDDVLAQADCLPKWDQEYTQIACGNFSGLLEELSCGPIQLFREKMDKVVDQQGLPWPDSYVIGVPISLEGNGYWCGDNLSDRCAFALAPNKELKFCTPASSDILVAAIDQKLASSVAAVSLGEEVAEKLLSASGVNEIDERIWRIVSCRLQVILKSVGFNAAILEVGNTRRMLLNDILTTVLLLLEELSQHGFREHHSKQFIHRHIVDKTREYVLSNQESPPTIIDICEALKISRRTLHYAFRKVLGVSPVSFLRFVRLNCVRKFLLENSSCDIKVSQVAEHFGFWHMGMFAHYYKNLFGELPSETLAKEREIKPSSKIIIPKY